MSIRHTVPQGYHRTAALVTMGSVLARILLSDAQHRRPAKREYRPGNVSIIGITTMSAGIGGGATAKSQTVGRRRC